MIDYNTGVLFFTENAADVFAARSKLARGIDSRLVYVQDGKVMTFPYADETSFALSIEENDFSLFVLPLNWIFRPQFQKGFFGPIKVWHSYLDPPTAIEQMNATINDPMRSSNMPRLTDFYLVTRSE